MKLTEAQRDAWRWTYGDGSYRPWHGVVAGSPPMATLMSLVRQNFLSKRGGNGWPSSFARTDAGRLALKEQTTNG